MTITTGQRLVLNGRGYTDHQIDNMWTDEERTEFAQWADDLIAAATTTAMPHPGPSGAGSSLLRPLKEVYESGLTPASWWVNGLIPMGAITLLGGYAKEGKSTVMMNILKHASTGDPWCGMRVPASRVWYLTEEGDPTMAEVIEDVGPSLNAPIEHMIGSIHRWGGNWPGLSQQLCVLFDQAPEEERPTAIIIDTLGGWAAMEDANDYAKITKVMQSLHHLRDHTGCAIVIITHTRKEGGDPIKSILGSTAFVSSVDHIIVMVRVPDHDDHRTLHCTGRLRGAQEEVTIRYNGDGGFDRVGELISPVLLRFDHQAYRATDIIESMKGMGWGEKRTRREITRLVEAGDLYYSPQPPNPNALLHRTTTRAPGGGM